MAQLGTVGVEVPIDFSEIRTRATLLTILEEQFRELCAQPGARALLPAETPADTCATGLLAQLGIWVENECS